MITRLKIEKLFGRFDYDLVFKERVTILTGPNGFGKSTVLRMIEALGSGVYDIFFQVPYDSFTAKFDNERSLLIKKNGKHLNLNDFKVTFEELESAMQPRKFLSPFFYRSEEEEIKFSDFPLDEQYRKKLINIYGVNIVNVCSFIYEIKTWTGNVKMLTEQRREKVEKDANGSDKIRPVIDLDSKELIREIGNVSNVFLEKSSEIDSDYFNRLFDSDEITEEQYNEYQKQVNKKFDRLERYNLIGERQQAPPFQSRHAAALKVYFDTFFEKYAAYDYLLEKLDLFFDIINNRLMFKKFEVSSKEGFKIVVVDDEGEIKCDESGKPIVIPLERLSSGEIQIILVYYFLVFIGDENLLLLVDEPEISMHIAWQKRFVDDLIKIAEHGNFRAIVATHSPQLIGKHRDLQIDLGEQYGG